MTWSIESIADPRDLATARGGSEWPALAAEEIARHGPDAAVVARGGDRLLARCSLWWTATPPLAGHRVGAIGHYAASDDVAAAAMLDEACRQLKRRGCTMAIGPMDGNTWRTYRLVVEPGTEPPFFLEPTNPAAWPAHFGSAGFAVLANYYSALNADLGVRDPRAAALEERMAERGITIRELNPGDFDGDVARIYSVAAVSFRENVLYTPLAEHEFTSQYAALRPVVEPRLVLLAEDEGRPVGFAFTVPDVVERQRTGAALTAIIKTIAILPERERYGGLGSLMVDQTHRAAARMGLTRVIHALMHETNQSRAISHRTGTTIRRYALFARQLDGG